MIAVAEVLKRIDEIRRIVYTLREGMPDAKLDGRGTRKTSDDGSSARA